MVTDSHQEDHSDGAGVTASKLNAAFGAGLRLPAEQVWRAVIERIPADAGHDVLGLARRLHAQLAAEERPRHPSAARQHLDHILPSLAVYRALRERAVTHEAAFSVVADVALRRATRQRRLLLLLSRLPGAFMLVRLAVPLFQKNFTRAGFDVRRLESTDNHVALEVTRCLYLDVFTRYDIPELTPAFCAVDDFWYDALAPRIRWHRAGTLATGACCCDIRFERGEKRTSNAENPSLR